MVRCKVSCFPTSNSLWRRSGRRSAPGKNFSVVHIASHFVLVAGSGDEPFLMMGGDNSGDPSGFEWNLSAMENSAVAFHGTRLLTLSACSTAKDYKSRNGLEMDSLGMVAQQKDAEAVLATLWDVNDLSTSQIMSDFYNRWVKNLPKAKPRHCARRNLRSCTAPPGRPVMLDAVFRRLKNLRRRKAHLVMLTHTTGRPSS